MANNLLLLQDILSNGIPPDSKFTDVSHFAYMWMNILSKKLIASHSVYTLLELEPYSVFLTESEYRKYVHTDDLFKLMRAEEKLSAQHKFSSVEYRIITKKGAEKYVHHHMQLVIKNVNEARIISILDDITEQKRADVILEVMNEGFFELDENFMFRRVNMQTESYWQVKRKNLIGKCIWDVFPQAVNTPYYKMITEAKSKHTSKVHDVLCPIMKCWLHLSVSPYADGLVVMHYNIHKEKEAEQHLKESKELLQSVFDTSLVDMSVLKAVRNKHGNIEDLKIDFVNKQLEKTTGRTDLKGKLYSQEYPGIKQTPVFNAIIKAIETSRPQQIEYHYGHDGFEKWFSSMFVKMEDDGIVSTNLDITERKVAEEEQAKNLKLLQQSEELAKSGSWDYNIVTQKFLWSDGMYNLFNMEKGVPVTPEVYLDYVITDDKSIAEKIVNNIKENFQPFNETLRIQADNIIKTVQVKASPLENNGKIEKMLGVDMDKTAAIKAEEKIKALNKTLYIKNRELQSVNSELQTFNSIAANNYQETFRTLYTNLEFIISNDAKNLTDAGKANIRRAQTAIQKMKLLTDDILSFSKIQQLGAALEKVNLNEIVSTVLLDMNSKILETNTSVIVDNLPVIDGYPLLLSLLFYHLIDNAIKFKKPDSKAEIKIQYKKIDNIKTKPDDATNLQHEISIKDNGIGFNQTEEKKLFNIFFRLHEKNKFRGSGIGLAVCKKIMDLHNGIINANGKENEGAEFCCYFSVD